ncbi:PadR family transcriptional regulator [Paucilactobacillus hokkaidonensis JCM 18461]|uniref:PadR family transcriptional regulator n=2 Tax=Paucilactobacillus hokkaidonensis TaxID=1193095 RepID=A0A0A1GRS9_9LACO|nr:PadR family transcriptional regulator [Paucilactobacillus hokkaidonensis]KRO09479.1 regulator of phenolic acid metabolism PadR [Paucilactobacillus hokkaidonensis]BAP84655.1 PadR family transcriptional regulator [Paucilactobacillus hokkaidonensis JCM 18461]
MAQRNKLKFIILGLLSENELTGYDITKAFDSDIGEFWSANHSQIYPLLKRLEDNQLITHRLTITGEKLEKKSYSITDQGTNELHQWISEPTPALSATKDEFILKLYFIHKTDDARLKPMLTEQLNLHKNKLTHLQQQMKSKFHNQSDSNNFGHFLILQHAIQRETGYTNWLTETIQGLASN